METLDTSKTSLYRKYRPQKFKEIVSQDAAVEVLMHSILNSRVGHAYLFSGSRGCGKTSAARIVAKAINCLTPLKDERRGGGAEPCGECANCIAVRDGSSLDVVEIDGASNNGVEEVRELKSHVTLAPFTSKYKVYIIDEVHMLSNPAFNALLKTLEEPPSYVVFILATTEPHKVPVTVRSRCQHIPFRGIGTKQIFEHLTHVCAQENVSAQDEALWETARQADGAMRDALSLLEQIIGRASSHGGEVTITDVECALGTASRPALERWVAGLHASEAEADGVLGDSFAELKRMMEGGTSPQRIFEEMFSLLRNVWLMLRWPSSAGELDASEQEMTFLKSEAPKWKDAEIRRMLASVLKLITQAKLGARSDILIGKLMLDMADIASPLPDVCAEAPAEVQRGHIRPVRPAAAEAVHSPMPVRSAAPRTEHAAYAPVAPQMSASNAAAVPQDVPHALAAALTVKTETLPQLDWREMTDDETADTLSRVHDGDFVCYAAMIGARFSSADNALLIDIADRYCFEALKTSRCRSSAARIFSAMRSGVFTRFGEDIFVCFDGGASPDAETLTPQPETPKKRGRQKPEPVRQQPAAVPMPEFVPPEMPSGMTESGGSEHAHGMSSAMPFEGLVRDVTRLMNGTVVMVKHDASETEIKMEDDEDE